VASPKGARQARSWGFKRNAVAICTAALLAACGGPQPLVQGALPQSIAQPVHQDRSGSHSYRVLFNFGISAHGYNGADPAAGLINVHGVLYGTTEYGGAYGSRGSTLGGTVFRISASGQESLVHSFTGGLDGADPVGSVITVNGMLYGTTNAGGRYGGGTVFSVSPAGKGERILHSFGHGVDGYKPRANLIFVGGKLYGTTYLGGTNGTGTIFSVGVAGGKERVLHSFGNASDGAYPTAGLINVKGLLYGTTDFGGDSYDGGTVFIVSTDGVEAVLYRFTGPGGAYPRAGLIYRNHMLYGTTSGGGRESSGTVFSMNTDGTNERVVYSFGNSDADGLGPFAGLIEVKGAFYGTTSEGGATGAGTAFRVSSKGNERVLHSFGKNYLYDGSTPLAALVYLEGRLYGTTWVGGVSAPSCDYKGACDSGTVFALAP
jgi:uncharacterized repeat protein (TIGR03803 family)